jgi:hypothetical protein
MPNLPCTIRFGANGDYRSYTLDGWSGDPNDTTHTWTTDHVAKLRLALEYAKNDRFLEIDVIPVKAPGIIQELFLFLNGGFASYWSVKNAGILSARLESSLFVNGENLFAFVAPKAVCPKELGFGSDQRILGFAFCSLNLRNI